MTVVFQRTEGDVARRRRVDDDPVDRAARLVETGRRQVHWLFREKHGRPDGLFAHDELLQTVEVGGVRTAQFGEHQQQTAAVECLDERVHVDGDARLLRCHADRVGQVETGGEFVLLLPFTDLPGALSVAEVVRRNLAKLALPHIGSLVANQVTCSLGCARLIPEPEIASSELVEMADVALYRAKRNGRNRIEIAD